MDVKLIKNSTGDWIDPAESGLQRELIDEVKKLESATNDVKFQAITLSAGVIGAAAAHGCKRVKLWTSLSDCYIGDEGSQPFLLKADIYFEFSINNLSQLRLISVAGGAVYLTSTN